MIGSQLSHNFAIKLDIVFMQFVDEDRVAHAQWTKSGIEADGPEISVLALFQLASDISMGAGL